MHKDGLVWFIRHENLQIVMDNSKYEKNETFLTHPDIYLLKPGLLHISFYQSIVNKTGIICKY